MKLKTIIVFFISVAICGLAATYRFHDSAHAMGTIRKGGGAVRHSALLDPGCDSWVLIATAKVAPPFRGNARVALEGDPSLSAAYQNAGPAVNLGIHHRPEFRDGAYYGLRPDDRIALWVKITRNGRESHSGCGHGGADSKGAVLCFYDTATDARLLSIPVRFIGKGGDSHVH